MKFEEWHKLLVEDLAACKCDDDLMLFVFKTYGSLIMGQIVHNDEMIKKLREVLSKKSIK